MCNDDALFKVSKLSYFVSVFFPPRAGQYIKSIQYVSFMKQNETSSVIL